MSMTLKNIIQGAKMNNVVKVFEVLQNYQDLKITYLPFADRSIYDADFAIEMNGLSLGLCVQPKQFLETMATDALPAVQSLLETVRKTGFSTLIAVFDGRIQELLCLVRDKDNGKCRLVSIKDVVSWLTLNISDKDLLELSTETLEKVLRLKIEMRF